MSNRQERNRRKARRRRAKLLETRYRAPPGFTVYVRDFDWGAGLGVAMQRDADGLRHAVQARVDRHWRHMDGLPEQMIERLLQWFNERRVN